MTSKQRVIPFKVLIPFPKTKASFDKLRTNLETFFKKLCNPTHAEDRYRFILDFGECGQRGNEVIFAVEEGEESLLCVWFFAKGTATITVNFSTHKYTFLHTSWTHAFELALGILEKMRVVDKIEGVSIAISFPKSD